MGPQKVVIPFGPEEIQEIERIVVDRDSVKALEFMEKVVRARIAASLDKGHCRPAFELGGKLPENLAPPLLGGAGEAGPPPEEGGKR